MKWSHLSDVLKDRWLFQGFAVFGSVLLTAVLIGLLARFDNTPILEWNGISLNAIVALTATILKGLVALTVSDCLGQAKWIWLSWQQRSLNDFALIDQGSRGPLGSVKMLWRSCFRSFICMGVMLFILSVPMDSFVQLAVGKTSAMIFKNDSSTQISYARRYSKGTFFGGIKGFDENGELVSDATASADLAMTAAVISGLAQPYTQVAQQTKYNCPSGDCTWDNFQSLTVCSACTELTDRLSRKLVPHRTTCFGEFHNLTVYSLPNGVRLTNVWRDRLPVGLMTGFGTSNESQSISFGSKNTLIWSMTMIRISDPNALWQDVSVTATECGLWYCVKNYDSTVKNGNLIELSSPAPSTRLHDSWQVTQEERDMEKRGKNITHHDDPSLKFQSSDTLDFRISSINLRTDLQLGDGFNVSQEAIYGISSLMDTMFKPSPNSDAINKTEAAMNGCTSQPGNSSSVLVQGINALCSSRWGEMTYTSTAMPFHCQSKDLNETFATLAKSMTNSIRENSDDNLVMIGKIGTLHVVYQARWEFLTLPIFLVAVNAVFLITIIYYTRKSGLAVLCSGSIPIVGLGSSIEPIFKEIRLRSRMEEAAKLQKVQFISVPKEKQGSDDVEDGPPSQGGDGGTPPQEHDNAALFHGTDGHEMVTLFVGDRLENPESPRRRRRSDEERSIVSPISLDSRGA